MPEVLKWFQMNILAKQIFDRVKKLSAMQTLVCLILPAQRCSVGLAN